MASTARVEDTTQDIQMNDRQVSANEAYGYSENDGIDNTPTSYDYYTFPSKTRTKINRLLSSIGCFWGVVSAATPWPMQYLPDPDSHNWTMELIKALNVLAEMTRTGFKEDAIYFAIRHMKERNDIPGNTKDGDISGSMAMAGDFVIRREDIEYSIRKMRSRVNSYRPIYRNPGHEGRYRRSGRDGRGRRDGARRERER